MKFATHPNYSNLPNHLFFFDFHPNYSGLESNSMNTNTDESIPRLTKTVQPKKSFIRIYEFWEIG